MTTPPMGEGQVTAIPLRPRSVSELVDAAFQLLRRDYLQHVLVVALPMVPYLVATMFYMRAIGIDIAQPRLDQFTPAYWAFSAIGGSIMYVLVEGAIALAASDAYFGKAIDVWSVHSRAFSRLGALLIAGFVRNLAIVAGFMVAGLGAVLAAPAVGSIPIALRVLGILGGFVIGFGLAIYLTAKYLVAIPAVMIEDLGPIEGLKRSSELSIAEKGRIIKTMLLMLVLYLGILLAAGITTNALLSRLPAVGQVLGAVANLMVLPVFGAIQTLLYYDLRIRKEGYDIEVMSRGISAAADQAGGSASVA